MVLPVKPASIPSFCEPCTYLVAGNPPWCHKYAPPIEQQWQSSIFKDAHPANHWLKCNLRGGRRFGTKPGGAEAIQRRPAPCPAPGRAT